MLRPVTALTIAVGMLAIGMAGLILPGSTGPAKNNPPSQENAISVKPSVHN